jgi:hypothetical protein
MYPTRIVIRCSLARASIEALAVAAWLILSAMVPGKARDEVRADTGNTNIVLGALSGCAERAHPSCESRCFGGVDFETSQSELKRQSSSRYQRMCVAYTA